MVDGWECPVCTFANSERSRSCNCCDAARPGGGGNNGGNGEGNQDVGGDAKGMAREEAKARQQEIRNLTAMTGETFVDGDWSGDVALNSAAWPLVDASDLTPKVQRWQRAAKLQGGGGREPWVVIRDSVLPDDIDQGALGDCWFLSSLAVLAEKPWMIEDCLLEKELDDSGAIMARICDGGRYRWLLLDDMMPCGRKYKARPALQPPCTLLPSPVSSPPHSALSHTHQTHDCFQTRSRPCSRPRSAPTLISQTTASFLRTLLGDPCGCQSSKRRWPKCVEVTTRSSAEAAPRALLI